MPIARRVVLPATPEACWDVLTDWERQADWMRDADRVDVLSDRRAGVGVQLAVRTLLFGVPAFTERLEVVAWEPPRRLEVAHRSAIRGTGAWQLDPVVGGTRFTWIEDVALPGGVLGRVALAVYRPVMRRLMRGTMQDLRRRLAGVDRPAPDYSEGEQGSPGGPG
jgi:carbon monoxide dehydrogenase subunit G